jgi:hypothetical protein
LPVWHLKLVQMNSASILLHHNRSRVGFASVASQTPSRSSELGINLASSESQSQPQALSGRLLRLPLEGSAGTVSEEGTSNRVRGPSQVPSLQLERPAGGPTAPARASSSLQVTVPRVTVSMIRVLCVLTLAPPSPYPSGPQGLLEMQLPISGPGRFTGQLLRRECIKSCYDPNAK